MSTLQVHFPDCSRIQDPKALMVPRSQIAYPIHEVVGTVLGSDISTICPIAIAYHGADYKIVVCLLIVPCGRIFESNLMKLCTVVPARKIKSSSLGVKIR